MSAVPKKPLHKTRRCQHSATSPVHTLTHTHAHILSREESKRESFVHARTHTVAATKAHSNTGAGVSELRSMLRAERAQKKALLHGACRWEHLIVALVVVLWGGGSVIISRSLSLSLFVQCLETRGKQLHDKLKLWNCHSFTHSHLV